MESHSNPHAQIFAVGIAFSSPETVSVAATLCDVCEHHFRCPIGADEESLPLLDLRTTKVPMLEDDAVLVRPHGQDVFKA